MLKLVWTYSLTESILARAVEYFKLIQVCESESHDTNGLQLQEICGDEKMAIRREERRTNVAQRQLFT